MRRLLLGVLLAASAAVNGWGGDEPAGPGNWSAEQCLPNAKGLDAYAPAAAFGQDVFLVAWKSGHLGPGDLRKGFTYIGDIVACLVDKSGKPRAAEPFAVCAAPDLQERPRIAFGGGVFLVVWQDFRNGKDWDIYAGRVSPDGKVLDADGILVCGSPHNQALPEVAWDGSSFQIVWQDYRSGTKYEVYGGRVDAAGKVLDPEGKVLVSANGNDFRATYSRYGAVVAGSAGQGNSLVFWRGTSTNKGLPIAGCHLLKDGAAGAKATYETTDYRTAPGGGAQTNFPMCLAAGPDVYLAGWTTRTPMGRGEAANDAHAAIFSKEGEMVKKMYLEVPTGKEAPRIRNPQAAWVGGQFLAAWDSYSWKAKKEARVSWPVETVCAALVTPSGEVSATADVSGSMDEPAICAAVASDGAGTGLVAYEKHPAKSDVPIRIGFRLVAIGPGARASSK